MTEGLTLDDLGHSFGREVVLDRITARFPIGNLVAILGPSGCGKTTLLRCVGGLLRPTRGKILFEGKAVPHGEARPRIAFAFQSPTLLPWRTALENVLLPAELLGDGKNSSRRDQAKAFLALVGLEKECDKLPSQLSGGMQQRVGLARALMTEPSLLLLDEPFGALDGITRDRLNETVRRIWVQSSMTILFVTHSIEEAVYLADQVLILSQRPARLVAVQPIELGKERDAAVRTKQEFFQLVTAVRKQTQVSQ